MRLNVIEGFVDHGGDAVNGGRAIEASEVEYRLTSFIQQLRKCFGRAIRFFAQRLQAGNQATLKVVIPQQGNVAIDAGRWRESCG